jgi:hypothetical protein
VRYFCTIYTHDCTPVTQGKTDGGSGSQTDGGGGTPVARVLVSGASKREAAARAYVECVGRERARLLRERQMPRRVAKLETNARAIAASLRKINRSGGECFLMDNLVEGWYVHVEPVVDLPRPTSPQRLRLPHPSLVHLSRTPSPN